MAPRIRPEGILAVTEIHELQRGEGGKRTTAGFKGERERERRARDATNSAGPVEGGDLNTRYEIEPMGRVRRMQISPITHAGYFAVIIAVHARGRISYGEFCGYPSRSEKFAVKYCPFNPEPATRIFLTPKAPVVHPRCLLFEYHVILSR